MVGDSILTPPPEDRWERNKRDDSRIRNQQYGFFRVAKEEIPDPAIASKSVAVPINDRWLGTWRAENGKQKLSITATSLTYGDDEFSWVGIRPKGVIKCCPAFYEGTTTKLDLLARLGDNPEMQKSFPIVNGLGEGNFKKIVLADPFLRKYFFIYDFLV